MQVRNTKEVEVVWRPIPNSSQELALDTRCDHTLYHGTRGPGKLQPLDEPVLTPMGWKAIGELKRGSKVLTPAGHEAVVTHNFPHSNRAIYKLTFDDGSSTRAGDEHLWKFKATGLKRKALDHNWHYDDTRTMLDYLSKGYHVLIPTINPAKLRPHPRRINWPVDPYLLGLWLGDGHSITETYLGRGQILKQVGFTNIDDELTSAVSSFGFIKSGDKAHNLRKKNDSFDIWGGLTKLKLHSTKANNKFVPEMYLQGEISARLAVLQGLMDTDGTCDTKGYCTFTSVSAQLAKDVRYLAWSLGAKATMTGPHKSFCNGEQKQDHYDVYIQPAGKFEPFRLKKKTDRIQQYMHEELTRRVVSIEYVGNMNACCIQIDDPEHLYITKDFIVTHNTITQLMRYRRRVGIGYGSFWRGIIFDREFKNLGDLVAQSKRFFPRFDDGAKFHESASDYKWVWPTGEELLFRHIKKVADYENFHGHEYPFIGWNELTKWPTGEIYDKICSTNRSSYISDGTLPNIPLEVFSTTNPSGPGHNWVKRRFINPAQNGEVVRREVEIFNPQTQRDEIVIKTQVAIFGSYRENIYLDPKYIASLDELTASDSNLRSAWLFGSWDVTAGGAFDDLWRKSVHIVPRFQVPAGWRVDRSFDWGSSHPFSVGWWAEADGTEATLLDGSTWCPAPGSLILIHEWYGVPKNKNGELEIGTNKGLKMSAGDISEGIKRREIELMENEWIQSQPWPGPADNQIRDVKESDVDTIEKKMADKGVRWTQSDKSPGSRKIGLQLARDMLENAVRGEGAGLYTMNHCVADIDIFPSLPRDEEKIDDVDTTSEDHVWDMRRYRVLKGKNRLAKQIKLKFAM